MLDLRLTVPYPFGESTAHCGISSKLLILDVREGFELPVPCQSCDWRSATTSLGDTVVAVLPSSAVLPVVFRVSAAT